MITGFAMTTRGSEKLVNDDKVVLGPVALSAGSVSLQLEEPFVAAVFDGVSQGGRGAEASNIAASLMLERLHGSGRNTAQVGGKGVEAAEADRIGTCLADIGTALVMQQRSHLVSSPIATTVSGVSVGTKSHIVGFNSGDSRVYRFRNGMLVQMTVDHTVAQSLADSGADDYLIDQAEEANAHAITKALGLKPGNLNADGDAGNTGNAANGIADVEDFGEFLDGDIYLGCTDGLSGFISRDDIKRVLSAGIRLDIAGKTLADMALHNGSYDNISLFLLAKIPVNAPAEPASEAPSHEAGSRTTLQRDADCAEPARRRDQW